MWCVGLWCRRFSVLILTLNVSTAAAAEPVEGVTAVTTSPLRLVNRAAWPLLSLPPANPGIRSDSHRPLPIATAPSPPPQRFVLYGSFAVLQALDAHSTIRAVEAGHDETNPVVSSVSGSPEAIIGLKAAATVATIVAAEKLWRRNRAAAIGLMVAVNVTYAIVVARNYGHTRR